MSAKTSVLSIPKPKLPLPNPFVQHIDKHRDFFSLSIATSAGETTGSESGSRASILDVLEAVKVFRDDFRVQFRQHIVCSDAVGPAAHDPTISLRSASLNDIRNALQEVLECMYASLNNGKQLSLLLHMNMQLSSEAGAAAGSSDGLVAPPHVALCFRDVCAVQVLHPADSFSSGAINDGYICAWLHSLPPCLCIVIAQVVAGVMAFTCSHSVQQFHCLSCIKAGSLKLFADARLQPPSKTY